MSFQLRLKTSSSQLVIRDLTSSSPVKDLIAKLDTDPNAFDIKLLHGFPPKVISGDWTSESDLAKALAEVGITSGDTVMAELIPKPVNAEPRLSGPSNPQPEHHSNPQPDLIQDGILLRKVVPADNHCLFTSVHFCMSGQVSPDKAGFMRDVIAAAVSADPHKYSDAILGRPNAEYCKWIRSATAWGGAIEVQILSEYFGVEITVVDTQSGSLTYFGEGLNAGQRMILIYDGIHYDPLYLEPFQGGANKTLFDASDESVVAQAKEVGKEAKETRQFTDVNSFQLKCLDCQVMLKGSKDAQEHAKAKGHTNFGEV